MSNYDASSIEVLTGLEPVKKRPGMYTDTENPNHLAQEVIDNSVDEAVSGYATQINVTLHKDNSMYDPLGESETGLVRLILR